MNFIAIKKVEIRKVTETYETHNACTFLNRKETAWIEVLSTFEEVCKNLCFRNETCYFEVREIIRTISMNNNKLETDKIIGISRFFDGKKK